MNKNNQDNSLLSSKINEGVKKAIANALERHQKLDESITILENDKIVTLKGNEIARLLSNNN